jgi:hypothetical protein
VWSADGSVEAKENFCALVGLVGAGIEKRKKLLIATEQFFEEGQHAVGGACVCGEVLAERGIVSSGKADGRQKSEKCKKKSL